MTATATPCTALARLGCELLDLGVVPTAGGARGGLPRGLGQAADVIITSGGVSVGEADFIREMMNRMGEVAFWKLAIKPGGRWPSAASATPCCSGFRATGGGDGHLLPVRAGCPAPAHGVAPLPRPSASRCARLLDAQAARRVEYLRGRLQRDGGTLPWRPPAPQGSGVLSSMSEADCFVVLPADCTAAQEGDTVFVQPFHGIV